jgi:DNA-binding transcriptional LysR family regulator
MNKFLEMQAFNTVADTGSFVKAANALNMSKAAVSRYVSDIESRLNTRLIQRTTRRLSLTEEGQIFYARSKKLLAELEEAEEEITTRHKAASGLLRINAPLTFGILHLAQLWGEFKSLNPKVTLNITLNDSRVDLIEENYDIVIRIAALENSTLISKRLATTRIVLCASPHYLKQHGTPTHPTELLQHAIIAYSYFATKDEWHFDGPSGPLKVKVRPYMHANNGDTCRAAALAHQGIILQPTFIVGNDLAQGTLVELMPEFRSNELGIYAVYPTKKHLTAKVRALIDFLAIHLAKKGSAW